MSGLKEKKTMSKKQNYKEDVMKWCDSVLKNYLEQKVRQFFNKLPVKKLSWVFLACFPLFFIFLYCGDGSLLSFFKFLVVVLLIIDIFVAVYLLGIKKIYL